MKVSHFILALILILLGLFIGYVVTRENLSGLRSFDILTIIVYIPVMIICSLSLIYGGAAWIYSEMIDKSGKE